jgi:hypothetical protein
MLKKLLLPAAGIAVAIGLAAPAHADPTDDQFISSLDRQGIPHDEYPQVVQEAKDVCDILGSGHSFDETVQLVLGVHGEYSPQTAAGFVGAAAAAYCPAYSSTGS